MLYRVLTATLLLGPGLAQAADNGLYLGAGVTHSDFGLENPEGLSPFDDKDTGFKAFAGWRPLDNFGIEASYADHGDVTVPTGIVCIALVGVPCPAESQVQAKSTSLFAVGYLDLPVIDLFAKAGVSAWQADGGSPSVPTFRFDDSGSSFAWGVGAQARFGSLAARAEYERFPVIGDEEIGMISLSLSWTFF